MNPIPSLSLSCPNETNEPIPLSSLMKRIPNEPSSHSPPLVSILMAVYNGERYLRDAVDSILAQTFTDFEFVIVDDGSTDQTAAILQSYMDPRIRVIRNPQNIGLTKSLNAGLGLCAGKYVARQDADDVSMPGRLMMQVQYLEDSPAVVVIGSACRHINAEGCADSDVSAVVTGDAGIRWTLLLNNVFLHSSVMFRRDVLVRQGLSYDGSLCYAQDYRLWWQLMRYGKGANIPEALYCMRYHPGNITAAKYSEQQECATRIAHAILASAGFSVTLADVALMRRSHENAHGRDRWRRVKLLARLYGGTGGESCRVTGLQGDRVTGGEGVGVVTGVSPGVGEESAAGTAATTLDGEQDGAAGTAATTLGAESGLVDVGCEQVRSREEREEWRRIRRQFKRDLIKAALWPPKYREAIGAWMEVVRIIGKS